MRQFALNAIAERVEGQLLGDPDLLIHEVTSCQVVYEGHCQCPGEGVRGASPPVVGF